MYRYFLGSINICWTLKSKMILFFLEGIKIGIKRRPVFLLLLGVKISILSVH